MILTIGNKIVLYYFSGKEINSRANKYREESDGHARSGPNKAHRLWPRKEYTPIENQPQNYEQMEELEVSGDCLDQECFKRINF